MEVTSINYFSNDGWENFTDYNYTPSEKLHIPRVGDTVKNKYGDYYTVVNVIWNLPTKSIQIECRKQGDGNC